MRRGKFPDDAWCPQIVPAKNNGPGFDPSPFDALSVAAAPLGDFLDAE
jgi:hypothetical protein